MEPLGDGNDRALAGKLFMWSAARLLPLFWNNRLATAAAFGGCSLKTAAASVPHSTLTAVLPKPGNVLIE
jgi:hypothetical protein